MNNERTGNILFDKELIDLSNYFKIDRLYYYDSNLFTLTDELNTIELTIYLIKNSGYDYELEFIRRDYQWELQRKIYYLLLLRLL